MKRFKYLVAGIIVTIGAVLSMPSCIDFSYEEVEPRIDSTTLSANTTIAELKSIYPGKLYKLSDTSFYQRDSIIIEGIVTSDDKEGNFYKSIFIEDETGAIELKLNKTTLYNDYKRGQKIVVVCNDLHLGDYGGQIQLGSKYKNNGVWEISGLEGDVYIKRHVFKKGATITEKSPLVMAPNQLNPMNIGRLVQFNNTQIKDTLSAITGKTFTYADYVGKVTINHAIVTNNQTYSSAIVLRTSGFARFAGETINTKNGTIIGILTYYKGTYQLLVRDLEDIQFKNTRFQI